MLRECISFFGFMITENFTMIEKLLEVLEILVLTLNKKRISLTSKTIHWGFWVNLYGEKEYVEGVQSFWLIQMKANLWKECKDGKGLVTEIYYGWTGGYPYMKVRQASSFNQTNIFLRSQWLFSTNAFQMLQSPLYGVASKLPAASTMVPVIVDHHDPACVHY